YSVGHSEAETERLTAAQRPVQNSVGIRNLTTGDTVSVEGIQQFSISPDGQFLAMRRYNPTPAAAGGGANGAARGGGGGGGGRGAGGGRGGGDAADPVGATIIVRQLATNHDTTFGNVGEFAWQDIDNTHLLALTIAADNHVGNGVQLFDPETAVLRVLEST